MVQALFDVVQRVSLPRPYPEWHFDTTLPTRNSAGAAVLLVSLDHVVRRLVGDPTVICVSSVVVAAGSEGSG